VEFTLDSQWNIADPPEEEWNVGIMEYWEYKADDGLILQTDPGRSYKKRSRSTKPSIPSFRCRLQQIDWL
jgi:hypothetical protein